MTRQNAIELGILARRERELLLRLENTRERIRELTERAPNKKAQNQGDGTGAERPVFVSD